MSKNGSVPPAQTAKIKGSKTILFLEWNTLNTQRYVEMASEILKYTEAIKSTIPSSWSRKKSK